VKCLLITTYARDFLTGSCHKLIQINKARRTSSHNKIAYDRDGNGRRVTLCFMAL